MAEERKESPKENITVIGAFSERLCLGVLSWTS